ncbi:hypothetical protein QNH10_01880 [Sporosarcina thermotolerans]|uniref:hypothetical protein n=1 Tax=Sporosarcina thermotolerans TaxID=633404 RepID=UPI0024BBF4DF|nr:hypothetical protein [Sporosarcina thermotolerans]WHT48607.1 hypothetical protein QNH10_01880 [Sporosarcina thermotolerans]
MSKTKYVASNGLAFSEKADMKMLRRNALMGWQLKRFRFAGYELEKAKVKMSFLALIIVSWS